MSRSGYDTLNNRVALQQIRRYLIDQSMQMWKMSRILAKNGLLFVDTADLPPGSRETMLQSIPSIKPDVLHGSRTRVSLCLWLSIRHVSSLVIFLLFEGS